MALYNMLCFALLAVEMALVLLLLVPMPHKVKRAMFKFIASSPLVAKAQYGMKILFIFVAILFADAVQHMLKVAKEVEQAKRNGFQSGARVETDYRSRQFLSQRNFYLTGFTLFLSFILSRVYSIVTSLIEAEDKLLALESAGPADPEAKKKYADLQEDYAKLSEKYKAATGTVSDKKKD